MKHLSRLFATALIVFTIAGCSGDAKRFWDGVGAVSTATVPGYTVIAAVQTFDGLELAAAAYLGLPRCTASSVSVCRIPSATPIIKGASQSGRVARAELKRQVRAVCAADFAAGRECTAGIPVASYNSLVAATRTIEDATAAYRLATGK